MSQDDVKPGLNAAIVRARELVRSAALEELSPQQLPLIPVQSAEDGVATGDAATPDQETRRGPGRPKGSRNRRTDEWVNFLLSRYQSPLVVLAETYSRPVAVLAAELNCDIIEAARIQLQAAKELAPYLHQKLPMADTDGQQGAVELTFRVSPEMAQALEADHEGVYHLDGEVLDVETG